MKKTFELLLFAIVLLGIVSCSKEDILQKENVYAPDKAQINKFVTGSSILKAGELIAPYDNYFDWENSSSIKTRYNGVEYEFFMFNHPDFFQGYATESCRLDVKKVDGWKLIYNWLLPSSNGVQTQFPAILLYNSLRGKFKLCYYHLDGNATSNSNVTFSMATVGLQTCLFNMNEIVSNPIGKAYTNSVTQSSDILFNNNFVGLMNNHWYIFEWDASYFDPNLVPGNMLGLVGTSLNFKNVNLTGNISGVINGKLVSTSSTKDYNSLVSTTDIVGAISGGSKSILKSIGKNNVKPYFSDLSKSSTNTLLKKAFSFLASDETIGNIAGAVAGPIGSIVGKGVSKLLGKIFPGKESTTTTEQSVELKASFKADISGSITEPLSFRFVKFKIPTEQLSPASYHGRFGLFRLTRKIKVGVEEKARREDNLWYCTLKAYFDEDPNALLEVNPDLLNEANVEYNISLVGVSPAKTAKLSSRMEPYLKSVVFDHGVKTSTVDNDMVISDLVNSQIHYNYKLYPEYYPFLPLPKPTQFNPAILPSFVPYTEIKVLVNFKVTPKNGGEPILINQLFEPEYIGHQTYDITPIIYREDAI